MSLANKQTKKSEQKATNKSQIVCCIQLIFASKILFATGLTGSADLKIKVSQALLSGRSSGWHTWATALHPSPLLAVCASCLATSHQLLLMGSFRQPIHSVGVLVETDGSILPFFSPFNWLKGWLITLQALHDNLCYEFLLFQASGKNCSSWPSFLLSHSPATSRPFWSDAGNWSTCWRYRWNNFVVSFSAFNWCSVGTPTVFSSSSVKDLCSIHILLRSMTKSPLMALLQTIQSQSISSPCYWQQFQNLLHISN